MARDGFGTPGWSWQGCVSHTHCSALGLALTHPELSTQSCRAPESPSDPAEAGEPPVLAPIPAFGG